VRATRPLMTMIEVSGVRELVGRLGRLGAAVHDQRVVLEQQARATQRMITGVPRDTGRLERSVRGGSETLIEVDADSFVIGSTVPYARHVFHGTRHVRARPPTVPRNYGADTATAIARNLSRVR
jgi:hypothetical protein